MITIAIDGYSSTGKSTMARTLALRLGYRYIDTGAMYRAVTLFALHNNIISSHGTIDEQALQNSMASIDIDFSPNADGSQSTLLNGINVDKDIRTMEVSAYVSDIAAIPSVRQAMVEKQRSLGACGGVVMDGRDIGTTVFPDAQLKIFVTASPEIRAQRRYKELMAKGQNVTYNEVLENVMHRDHLDETRAVSPLRRAHDALLLDNSDLSIESQNDIVLNWARKAIETPKDDTRV